jgi:hypothetical protein
VERSTHILFRGGRCFCASVLILLFLALPGQVGAYGTELVHAYGGTGAEFVWSVIEHSIDQGCALAGYTNSIGAGDCDFMLVKTDSVGMEIWTKTFGGISYDDAYSVIKHSIDNGLVVAGMTCSTMQMLRLLDVFWTSSGRGAVCSAYQHRDGGFFIWWIAATGNVVLKLLNGTKNPCLRKALDTCGCANKGEKALMEEHTPESARQQARAELATPSTLCAAASSPLRVPTCALSIRWD